VRAGKGQREERGGRKVECPLFSNVLHVAEGHVRCLHAPELLPLVYAGIQFVDGIQKPITPQEAAPPDSIDTPLLP
jgi:hypothetical protein